MHTYPTLQNLAPAQTIASARLRRDILIGVCLALMAVIASVSGLNVAQQQIAVALDASQAEVLWMINIYAVTLAALLLPLGAFGDRWGRQSALLIGLGIFGVANAAAGLAPNTEIMLAARFLSGIGAAMIMPVTLAVITSTFPAEERSKAIGIWTGVAGGGGLLGMFLSALLVDVANWRWLFVLPIVLALVAGAITLRSVPNSRETSGHRFDFAGALLSGLTVVGLIFFLDEGPKLGWTSPFTLTSLVIGVIGAFGFGAWEARQRAPLMNLRLFRKRSLASGSLVLLVLLVLFGVQAGIFIVLFPYFQAVLGWSGLLATVALMPMAVAMMIFSGLAPRLTSRLGARLTMAAGILLSGCGMALMAALVAPGSGYLAILPGMLAWGIGTGLAMTPATEAITSALPLDQQGVASALNDVTREFGTALGVALLGAVFTAGYRGALDAHLQGLPAETGQAARKGLANAIAAAARSPQADELVSAAQAAFIQGWQQAIWSGVVVMALLLVYILLRGPQPEQQAQ